MTSDPLLEGADAAALAGQTARVFVALKVAPQIAGQLAQLAQELVRMPARLIAPNDIHLTLVPPWQESSTCAAVEKLRRVTDEAAPISLAFIRLSYGPQPRKPRLLWAECAPSEELAALRIALLSAFGQSDERPFRPHVTIARLKGNCAAVARKHPIDYSLTFTQCIDTVELMQSPPPGEIGYRVLASLPLTSRPTH